MSDESTKSTQEARVGSPRPSPSGLPILRLVPPFTAFAFIAVLLGRALGPSVAGLAVGMGRFISAIEFAGRLASQLYAMIAIVFAMALIIAASSKIRVPPSIRLGAVGLGGAAILVALLASPRRAFLPPLIVGVMAFCAVALALLSARSALAASITRAAAMVIGLVGLSAIVRLAAVGLAYQSNLQGFARLAPFARGASTLGFVLDLCAVGTAVVWIASRGKKLTSPATLVTLALALGLTRLALGADREGAGPAAVLVRRAAERLLPLPLPLFPVSFQLFAALLALVAAAAALIAGRRAALGAGAASHPASGAVIALALLVRDAPEMPLGALTLVIASLGVALATRDDRGIWAALPAKRG